MILKKPSQANAQAKPTASASAPQTPSARAKLEQAAHLLAKQQAPAAAGQARTTALPERDKVAELLGVLGPLSDLIAEENMQLKAHNNAWVAENLSRKQHMSRLYESLMKDLAESPEALKRADPATKQTLTAYAERMAFLGVENTRLLKAAQTAQERLMESVAEALRTCGPAAASYSQKGTMGSGNERHTPGSSLTVNTEL